MIISSPSIAAAQTPRVYFGGALSTSSADVGHANGGSPGTSYDNTSTDSMATGVQLEMGAFANRSASIGVEIGIPFGRTEILQHYGYDFLASPYDRQARYRARTVFVVIRGEVQAQPRLRVGLLGGVGVVFESSLNRYSVRSGPPSFTYGPFGNEREQTGSTRALTGGADFAFEASKHLSVVPQVRLMFVPRGSAADFGFGDLGLFPVVYRLAVGVRASF